MKHGYGNKIYIFTLYHSCAKRKPVFTQGLAYSREFLMEESGTRTVTPKDPYVCYKSCYNKPSSWVRTTLQHLFSSVIKEIMITCIDTNSGGSHNPEAELYLKQY